MFFWYEIENRMGQSFVNISLWIRYAQCKRYLVLLKSFVQTKKLSKIYNKIGAYAFDKQNRKKF